MEAHWMFLCCSSRGIRIKTMHIFAGEKPVEDKERRKRNDLINVAKEIFYTRKSLSYSELSELLCEMLDVKERTSKNYIQYMKSNGIISQIRTIIILQVNSVIFKNLKLWYKAKVIQIHQIVLLVS